MTSMERVNNKMKKSPLPEFLKHADYSQHQDAANAGGEQTPLGHEISLMQDDLLQDSIMM